MRQFKPLPPDMALGPTLARRVCQLREFRNMTVRDLARLSRFSLQKVEDIESGLETWLSATERQLLAKALSVEPAYLQEVETRSGLEGSSVFQEKAAKLTRSILAGARDLECPSCGGTLKCSVQDAYDIEGNPLSFAKAYCLKCPFVLR